MGVRRVASESGVKVAADAQASATGRTKERRPGDRQPAPVLASFSCRKRPKQAEMIVHVESAVDFADVVDDGAGP